MTRRAVGVSLALVSLVVGLSGCAPFLPPPPDSQGDPSLDFHKVTRPNAEPDPASDCFPLRPGSFWRYRDATPGHLPTHPPAPPLFVRMAATVVSADGTELSVLETESAGEPERVEYLHRAEDGVYAHGGGSGRAVNAFPVPILEYSLPFERERAWAYTIGGDPIQVRVLFQEAVVTSLGVFQGCWKVEVTNSRTQGVEYRFYAPGVGLVKLATGSADYELADSSLTSGAETILLDMGNRGGEVTAKVGDRLIVEFPAKEGSGYTWKRTDRSDLALPPPPGGGEFYADLIATDDVARSGKFVYRTEAAAATPIGEPAILSFAYTPLLGGEPAYTFSVKVRIAP